MKNCEVCELERELLAAVKDEIKLAKSQMAVQYRGTPYGIKAAWKRFADIVNKAGYEAYLKEKKS